MIDLGFDVHVNRSIRFDGIDAPEKTGATKAAGLAAKDALMKLLPSGTEVVLKTKKPANKSDEKFGRMLARVWLDGKDLSQALLDAGVVKAYSGKGARPK
jgi:endonuclease YncB( thermonuclease family)